MPNLTNITARHAHFVEQFKNGEIKKFTPFLNRVAKGMREELLKSDNVYSKAVMRRKLAFIDSLVSGEFKTYTDQLSGDLGLFADEEAEFTAASLNKVQALVEATIPASSQLKAAINARPFANRLLKDYLNDFSKDQAKAVKNAVSMGFFEGKSTKDIINDVVGSKSLGYKNGILNVSRTSAERMVRTSIAHTASVAKSYTLEDNIDITPYYEWSSILDGRTSPICQAGDNTIYPVGKGPLAPHHYNCRSVEVALFDDDVEIVNGKPVKVDTSGNEQSYNTWLGKQSNKFQDEVLGATKAELYRKGGLTVDKFVNNAGQTLTLAQLRSKYASAWGKTFDTVTPIKAAVVKVAPKPIVTKVTRPQSFDTADKPTKQWFNNSFDDDIYNNVMSKVKVTSDINNTKKGAFYTSGKINMGSKDLNSAGARNTFRHEFGHHVDYTISNSLRTQQSDWKALQRADSAIVLGKEKELLQAYKKLGFTSRRRGYNAVKNMRTEAIDLVYNDMIDLNLNTYAKALAWGQKNIPEGTIARRLLDATDGVTVSQFWENDLIRSVASLKHAQDMGGSSLLAIQTIWENPTLWRHLNNNSVGMTGVLDNTFALGKGFGGGHTAAYYKTRGGTGEGKEIFANLFAASSKDSSALAGDLYNELMPNLVNLMKEVIGGG